MAGDCRQSIGNCFTSATTRADQIWHSLPGYLVFSNGWAAYQLHTMHGCDGGGDVALLRTSDGSLYMSHMHFCAGIAEEIQSSPDTNTLRPADISDFLIHHAVAQRWRLVAHTNELWCVVNAAEEDFRHDKRLWIWISTADGTNRITLCDQQQKLRSNFASWTPRWISSDTLQIDLFDLGPLPPRSIAPAPAESNFVSSLIYKRDPESGKFKQVNL